MIIADSSSLFSLFIETDTNYSKAIAISKQYLHTSDTVIIPEDVFSELINILGKKFDHKKATIAARVILDTTLFLLESTTEEIREIALEKFEKQTSSVSFTDCIVMAFADHFNTKRIFGFDKIFSQSGYTFF